MPEVVKPKTKIRKEMIFGAFIGGMTMSLLELMTAMNAGEYDMLSIFFIIGCLVSGMIGIIGSFIIAPTDFRNAITTGIAAPSILGGLMRSGVAKTTTTTVVALMNMGIAPVCADPADSNIVIYDTINVGIVSETTMVIDTPSDGTSTGTWGIFPDSFMYNDSALLPTRTIDSSVVDQIQKSNRRTAERPSATDQIMRAFGVQKNRM
jgi:hypothetical protein